MIEALLTVLLLLKAGIVGYFYGQGLKKQNLDVDALFERGPRGWSVLGLFLLIAAGIGVSLRFPRLFPPAVMVLLEPLSWIAVKAVIVFLLALAWPLSQQKSKQYLWSLSLFSLGLVGGVQGLQGYFLRPIPLERIKVRLAKDGSILQSTGVTCVAASLANAVRFFGLETSEREAARILGTRDTGTTDVQLLNGLLAYGLYGHYVPILPEQLRRMNRPAFISVDLKVITHSILYYGHDQAGNLFAIDPIHGRGKYPPQKFKQSLYIDHGIVVTDRPLPEINADSPLFLLRQIQGYLKAAGHLQEISGAYDAAMVTAIKKFQSQYQLRPTGIIDDATYLLLTGPAEKTWKFADPGKPQTHLDLKKQRK